MARSPIGISGFGSTVVYGARRVPLPPARMTARLFAGVSTRGRPVLTIYIHPDMPGEPLIPLFDIRLSEDEVGAVADTLRSGWLTQGPRTEAFEHEFAGELGARHVVALASGTAALHLAYLAAGV